MSRNIIIAVVAWIVVGCTTVATPATPDVTVYFDVTRPDFSIITNLTDLSGGNSTSTTAECAMAGTGHTTGTIEGRINSETGWNSMYGTYFGSEVDLSSTFHVQASRTGEGTSSTFTASQGVDAVGVGPLEFATTGQLLTGLYVYGEASACSVTDTWVLGVGQTFEITADSITGTAENLFEQRDNYGSLIGNPVANQFSVTATGGDSYTATGEGGSYTGLAPPGFGIASSSLYLEVQDDSGYTNANNMTFTDQIVGETATWYDYTGYPTP